MGKGEIARYEQFLLFPQCFQKIVLQTRKNQGLFGKGLNRYAQIVRGHFITIKYVQYPGSGFTKNCHELF